MILVSKTEPFVGLQGPDPSSEFIAQPTNPTTTGLFINELLMQIKVSSELVWGADGTRFLQPEEEFNVVALNKFITELIVDWKQMYIYINQDFSDKLVANIDNEYNGYITDKIHHKYKIRESDLRNAQ